MRVRLWRNPLYDRILGKGRPGLARKLLTQSWGEPPRVDEVRVDRHAGALAVRDESANDERVHAGSAVSGWGRRRRGERRREGSCQGSRGNGSSVRAPILPPLSVVEQVAYARCVGKSTPQQPVDTATRELAESLLAQAGLGTVVDVRPLVTASNAHDAVAASDGGRYVLRRFKENPPPHTALVRLDRECWVYRQLAIGGAPRTSSTRNVEGARR